MLICKFCNQEKTTNRSLAAHQTFCKQNPDKKSTHFESRSVVPPPWNKGLDISHPLVQKNAVALSKSMKGMVGRVWTDQQKANKSEWRKQLHKDHPEAHPNRRLANNRNTMSYPEKVAYDWLLANNIQFEHQQQIDIFYPDFVIGTMIIEIDGAYWHDLEKDAARDLILSQKGFTIHRICAKDNIEIELARILK